jgi:hypothetical protein
MNRFFNSQFITDLENGKLPPVQVVFSRTSLIEVAGTLVLVSLIVILAQKLVSRAF